MDNTKNPTTQTSMDNGSADENQNQYQYTVKIHTDNQTQNDESNTDIVEIDIVEIDGVSYCKNGQCDNCKSCIYESEQEDERIKGLSMLYLD